MQQERARQVPLLFRLLLLLLAADKSNGFLGMR